MKTFGFLLFFLFLYSFSLFGAPFQDRKIYNIYTYTMKLDEGELSSFYKSSEHCFTSWVEYFHTRDFYYLKTEQFDLKFNIAQTMYNKQVQPGLTVARYLVSRTGNPHPFTISEIQNNEKFYIVVTPIRFNHKSGIDEAGMVISTEDVCKN